MPEGFSREIKFVEYKALEAGRLYYSIGHHSPYLLIAAKNENDVIIGIPVSEVEGRFRLKEVSTEGGFLDLGPLTVECSLDPTAFKVSIGDQDDVSGSLVVAQSGPMAIALWQAQDRRWYLPFEDNKLRYANMGSRRAVCKKWRIVIPTSGAEPGFSSFTIDVSN